MKWCFITIDLQALPYCLPPPPPFKLINTIVKLENFGMEKKVLLRNKKKPFGSDWLNRKSVVHLLTIRLRSAKQTYCEKNDLLKPLYHRFYIYNIWNIIPDVNFIYRKLFINFLLFIVWNPQFLTQHLLMWHEVILPPLVHKLSVT